MESAAPVLEFLARMAAQAADGLKRFLRLYLAVLFDPGHKILDVTSGSAWPFPLGMIGGYSLGLAVLLRVAWSVAARGLGLRGTITASHPSVPLVFLVLVVFLVALSIAALLGVRIFTRQRGGLLSAMSCVAVALVPLSALTVAAWVVLYLSPALALLVLVFGSLVAWCFFVEALRNQYDLSVACSLYVIPLMVVVALLVAGIFLFALGYLHSKPQP